MYVLEWYLSLLGDNSEIINQVFGWFWIVVLGLSLLFSLLDKSTDVGDIITVTVIGCVVIVLAFARGVEIIAIITIPLLIAIPFVLTKYVINHFNEKKQLAKEKEYDENRERLKARVPEKDGVDVETFK